MIIESASTDDAAQIAMMVGELLAEIMAAIGSRAFKLRGRA